MKQEKSKALVIGASSAGGLGEAVARRMVRDGMAVTIAGRRVEALTEIAQDIGCAFLQCDVTDENSIAQMLERTGQIDVLVNAAGTTGASSIAALDRATVEDQMQIHYVANMLLLKNALKYMNSPSSIILFSSLTAKTAGYGLSAYSCAKAAVEQLVRVAALEFGSRDIRVNAIAPGFSHTPMTEGIFSSDALRDMYVGSVPLGQRGVEPGEVASAAAWLASPGCFTTGETIQLSGGAQLGRMPSPQEIKQVRKS